MKKLVPVFAISLLVTLMSSRCQKTPGPASELTTCNFYYWKTTLEFNKKDKALADSLGMKKLYLRYFDVDWSPTLEMPVPVGEATFWEWTGSGIWGDETIQIADYQVVPTIYLTNRIFTKEINVDSLVARISRKIQEKTQELGTQAVRWGASFDDPEMTDWEEFDTLWQVKNAAFLARFTEIQLDCDWTPSTRERYFAFLKAMKKANPGTDITCTVRLHQFRDREQAGIPPVDQATLMCYNVAPPKDFGTADAIFDPALVEGYLKNGGYPLPLEAALPLFSWGALFHENQFKGLASELSEADIKNNPLFAAAGEGRYRFTQDTVFAEVYMREGDIVRLDGPSQEELAAAAGRLTQIKAVKSISFFDWNADKIREYHVDEIIKKFNR